MDRIPIAVMIGDRHISENPDVIMSTTEQAVSLAQSIGVDVVIDLGDVFTYKRSQTTENLSLYGRVLDKFQEGGIKVYAITGNHDKPRGDDEFSFLSPFRHHPALELTESTSVMTVGGLVIGMLSYFNATYLDRFKILKESVKSAKMKIGAGTKSVLMTHKGVDGATDNDGRTIKSSLDASVLTGYTCIYSGHYHNRSSVGKVNYIGSMYQSNYGEDGEKGAAILYSDGSHEPVQFEFPTYGTKVIEVGVAGMNGIETLVSVESKKYDNLRVVLVGSKDELSSIKKSDIISFGATKVVKESIDERNPDKKSKRNSVLKKYRPSELVNRGEEFFKDSGYDNVELGVKILKEALDEGIG